MGALADFEAKVSAAIRRGTKYDTEITEAVVDAVWELESNYSFRHMWQLEDKPVTTGNRDISFIGTIKSIRFVRWEDDDGGYQYISKVEPEDVIAIYDKFPEGYFYRSMSSIRLDNRVDQDYTFEVGWYKIAAPGAVDDDLAWLTWNPALLRAETVVQMAPLLRDEDLVKFYTAKRDRALAIIQASDIERQFDGADLVMSPFTRELQDADLLE
jgi:hypothetical protein